MGSGPNATHCVAQHTHHGDLRPLKPHSKIDHFLLERAVDAVCMPLTVLCNVQYRPWADRPLTVVRP